MISYQDVRHQLHLARDKFSTQDARWSSSQWWTAWKQLFVLSEEARDQDDIVFCVLSQPRKEGPFTVVRRTTRGCPTELAYGSALYRQVDWHATFCLNLVMHTKYLLTVALGRIDGSETRVITREVYPRPFKVEVNSDGTTSKGAAAISYPTICFTIDDFEDAFRSSLLSSRDQRFIVALQAQQWLPGAPEPRPIHSQMLSSISPELPGLRLPLRESHTGGPQRGPETAAQPQSVAEGTETSASQAADMWLKAPGSLESSCSTATRHASLEGGPSSGDPYTAHPVTAHHCMHARSQAPSEQALMQVDDSRTPSLGCFSSAGDAADRHTHRHRGSFEDCAGGFSAFAARRVVRQTGVGSGHAIASADIAAGDPDGTPSGAAPDALAAYAAVVSAHRRCTPDRCLAFAEGHGACAASTKTMRLADSAKWAWVEGCDGSRPRIGNSCTGEVLRVDDRSTARGEGAGAVIDDGRGGEGDDDDDAIVGGDWVCLDFPVWPFSKAAPEAPQRQADEQAAAAAAVDRDALLPAPLAPESRSADPAGCEASDSADAAAAAPVDAALQQRHGLASVASGSEIAPGALNGDEAFEPPAPVSIAAAPALIAAAPAAVDAASKWHGPAYEGVASATEGLPSCDHDESLGGIVAGTASARDVESAERAEAKPPGGLDSARASASTRPLLQAPSADATNSQASSASTCHFGLHQTDASTPPDGDGSSSQEQAAAASGHTQSHAELPSSCVTPRASDPPAASDLLIVATTAAASSPVTQIDSYASATDAYASAASGSCHSSHSSSGADYRDPSPCCAASPTATPPSLVAERVSTSSASSSPARGSSPAPTSPVAAHVVLSLVSAALERAMEAELGRVRGLSASGIDELSETGAEASPSQKAALGSLSSSIGSVRGEGGGHQDASPLSRWSGGSSGTALGACAGSCAIAVAQNRAATWSSQRSHREGPQPLCEGVEARSAEENEAAVFGAAEVDCLGADLAERCRTADRATGVAVQASPPRWLAVFLGAVTHEQVWSAMRQKSESLAPSFLLRLAGGGGHKGPVVRHILMRGPGGRGHADAAITHLAGDLHASAHTPDAVSATSTSSVVSKVLNSVLGGAGSASEKPLPSFECAIITLKLSVDELLDSILDDHVDLVPGSGSARALASQPAR